MNRLIVVLLVTVLMLGSAGCLVDSAAPVVQPVLEVSTTGVTQYDYKAGPPGVYNVAPVDNTVTVNTYLVPHYEGIADNFTWTRVAPVYHHVDYYGNWGWVGSYYNPAPLVPVVGQVFWTGSAVVTVQ